MDHCHKNGIIHRDLKPDNLICTKNYILKIADFGLAGIVPDSADKILKTAVGTMAYMAPELFEIRKKADGSKYQGEPVDIFSAGVILFTLIRGIMPFEQASDSDTAGNWQTITKGAALGTFDPFWERHKTQSSDEVGLSDTFMRLIEGLLHPEPEHRWNIQQIKQSAWFNEDEGLMPEAEVTVAMKARRHATKAELRKRREQSSMDKKKEYTRAFGEDDSKYDEDEESLELMSKIKKHNERTAMHLSTLLLSNSHPIELKERLAAIFSSAMIDFKCVDEEKKPFTFSINIDVENEMIPLEGPSNEDADF